MRIIPPHPSARPAAIAGLLLLLAAADTALAHEGHHHSTPAAPAAAEQPFLQENQAAMAKMMQAMDVSPSGDIDRDLVAMMTPHHQGAIDMATALLRHGGNERLRRLAQEIIVTQQDEITAMRLAINVPLPPSTPAPTQVAPAATPAP